jgi:hypothetical protein
LKEDKAFSLSLEEKKLRSIRLQISSFIHSVEGVGDFVDTVTAVKML